mmetsp:Transcript_18019/g.30796  ORF Transcript_18019/g.30796 Transcript_18019/m.30796 type:complete len:536 (+) Transcript_18019:28-1635(+)|eukprot:CAMPEP_0119107280 /NCGR_PEP_ID=MMETSP1180-20130426/9615_1 /TAXON_ID=3052 ORGANISM="Chlamydomonas cf sp, Strain CCMP681" /NCGR_SAMPLE_ID=MMETSP1180 /ASSEMBLY_ACC=CAM_ASM_000741 /LENGTH=535 /DNA_ID=CAMNT_0007092745 /DNA_START=28 /DNA_END=1635 /DNA_ORIENTATION=-
MRRSIICAMLALTALWAGTVAAQDACSSCKWAVRVLDDMMCDEAATEWTVGRVRELICPVVQDKDQCNQLADALVPIAIQWLRTSATPQQLCSSAGVCSAQQLQLTPGAMQAAAKRAQRKSMQDDVVCSVCEYVVTEVKLTTDDHVTLSHLRERAMKACTKLPEGMQGPCSDMVTNYAAQIMAFLDSVDPVTTCTSAGLCTAAVLNKVKLPALPYSAVRLLGVVQDMPNRVGDGNMCDMCRLTVLEVHTLVSNPGIQGSILNYTKGLCDQAGASSDVCRQYIDLYGPAVFVMLEQYLQPDPLCVGVGMCVKPPAFRQTRPQLLPGVTLDALQYMQARQQQLAQQLQEQQQQDQEQLQRVVVGLSNGALLMLRGQSSEPEQVQAAQEGAELMDALMAASLRMRDTLMASLVTAMNGEGESGSASEGGSYRMVEVMPINDLQMVEEEKLEAAEDEGLVQAGDAGVSTSFLGDLMSTLLQPLRSATTLAQNLGDELMAEEVQERELPATVAHVQEEVRTEPRRVSVLKLGAAARRMMN